VADQDAPIARQDAVHHRDAFIRKWAPKSDRTEFANDLRRMLDLIWSDMLHDVLVSIEYEAGAKRKRLDVGAKKVARTTRKTEVNVCPSCGGPMAIERGFYARAFCPNCG
jgi:hypothetical protein